jgi:hypothetical protein
MYFPQNLHKIKSGFSELRLAHRVLRLTQLSCASRKRQILNFKF